jgi:hypothetical protein
MCLALELLVRDAEVPHSRKHAHFPFSKSILLITSPPTVSLAAEWYVVGSVAESGNGTSWEQAFSTIQEGIDAASDGDAVTVAGGTYVQNVQFKGKNIALKSTDPLNSTVVENTIIDGNRAGSIVTFSGKPDGDPQRCRGPQKPRYAARASSCRGSAGHVN